MNEQSILDAMNRRYAVKKFDSSKPLEEDKLNTILEAMRLSPSAFGIQGWTFVVVSNPEIKQQLRAHSHQEKIIQAPYFLVLCRRTDIDSDCVQSYIESIAQTRGIALESLDGLKQGILSKIESMDELGLAHWIENHVYIALGVGIETAALLGVDAGPMQGFDKNGFDEVLKLKDHNLTSVVAMALGYRASEDVFADYKKVRRGEDRVVIRL